MNNSLDRIYEAMSAALRRDILPRLDDAHARRQAIALIDLLNHLRLKTEWSPDPLRETVSAQIEALREVQRLFDGLPIQPRSHPLPPLPDRGLSVSELTALRDLLDEIVSRTLEWIDRHREEVGSEQADTAAAILKALMHQQLRRELLLTPKPLFGEM